jgi:hypothetical protein
MQLCCGVWIGYRSKLLTLSSSSICVTDGWQCIQAFTRLAQQAISWCSVNTTARFLVVVESTFMCACAQSLLCGTL